MPRSHTKRTHSQILVGTILGVGLLIAALIGLGNRSGTGPGPDSTFLYLEADSPVVTDDLTNPGKTTVLWFSATWCHICQQMSPYVQGVVERHADQVAITERDVDREPGLARQHAVRGTPTFVLLDEHGETIARRAGFMSESQFEVFITQQP